MPLYQITHATRYRHRSTGTAAWQSLHLQPRHEAAQHCNLFELEVSPHPEDLTSRLDYFGNKQHLLTLHEVHKELSITSRSLVRRDEPELPPASQTSPMSEARQLIDRAVLEVDFTLEQFRHPSRFVPFAAGACALAAELGLTPDLPSLTWFETLGRRFNEAFIYDAEATEISTPLTEVLKHRRGVCQDFAHLLVSCLRQEGLPAAYVSGYLLTKPPPGRERLRGADATHAWVSAYLPGAGWIDYDPTNACFAGNGHIVVARGRDFSDVSPVKGLFSGGAHKLMTEVTVELAETESGNGSSNGSDENW
jgi:transglutaminase-like putative cysteine protease